MQITAKKNWETEHMEFSQTTNVFDSADINK